MNIVIEKMKSCDWDSVLEIYRQGMKTGNATFETKIPDWESWDKIHLKNCRLVAKAMDEIVGWCALSQVSRRHVYRGVAEVSVYVAETARGKGIGKYLLQTLMKESEQTAIWTLQAGIFPENQVSITLFKSCGFREVGIREKIGEMNDVWRDVVLLERRSKYMPG